MTKIAFRNATQGIRKCEMKKGPHKLILIWKIKKKKQIYITALNKEVPTLLQIKNFTTALKDITLKGDAIKCTFKCIKTV